MEQVSLLQLSDWLVRAGVDPAKMPSVSRNASKLANIYVPMDTGWQNGSADTVIQKLMYAKPTQYTDETGTAPPVAQGPVARDLLSGETTQQVGADGATEADLDVSLADVYDEASSFGMEPPPGLDLAMPAPPSVSMPYMGGGMPSEQFNGSVHQDSGGGYDNASGGTPRLPFYPEANDNYGIGREVNDALRTAGAPGGDPGGGGGGGASDTYWNLRNKLEGIGSGGSSSYGSGGYSSGGGGYYDASDAKLPKNHGFSKPYDEEQLAATIQGRGTSILPRIAKDESAAGYQYLADMPVEALLALSDAGTRKKSWYGKSRTTKSGYVIPPKFKQGKYTNSLADIYREIQGGGGEALDPDAMMNNLINARKKSFVGQQFTRKVPVGDQADAMSGHLEAIRFAETGGGGALGADLVQGMQNHDEYVIDQWAQQNLKKKKPKRLNRYMGNQGYGV